VPEFLEVQDVLLIHRDQIDRYGGEDGIRELSLLESAVAQARASFGGEPLHSDVFEMAAAYLYHIVQNHPFVDGNKRTGLVSALMFLDFNDMDVVAGPGDLYDLTMAVACGQQGKVQVAEFFRSAACRR
jgi:death-on-curing protein